MGTRPTPDSHSWYYDMPRDISTTTFPDDMTEAEIEEFKHTLIIQADNLTEGTLYFGVKQKGMHFHLQD